MDEYFPTVWSYLWRNRHKWVWSWLLGSGVSLFFLVFIAREWYFEIIFTTMFTLNFLMPLVGFGRTYRNIVAPAQVLYLVSHVEPIRWDDEWVRMWAHMLIEGNVPRFLAEMDAMKASWEDGPDAMKVQYKGE